MLLALAVFLFAVGVCIVVLMPLYAQLLRALERYNPDVFVALGQPTLWMASPERGIRLQRFIYADCRRPEIHPRVRRVCCVLAVLTPLLVAGVTIALTWGVMGALSHAVAG